MSYTSIPRGIKLQWPPFGQPLHQPQSVLDYTYNATAETLSGADPIVGASLSLSPSGQGETQASSLAVANGQSLTVWLHGGVAGRYYIVKLLLTLQSGRVDEVLIGLPIDATLAADPPPAPASTTFGTPLTWPATP